MWQGAGAGERPPEGMSTLRAPAGTSVEVESHAMDNPLRAQEPRLHTGPIRALIAHRYTSIRTPREVATLGGRWARMGVSFKLCAILLRSDCNARARPTDDTTQSASADHISASPCGSILLDVDVGGKAEFETPSPRYTAQDSDRLFSSSPRTNQNAFSFEREDANQARARHTQVSAAKCLALKGNAFRTMSCVCTLYALAAPSAMQLLLPSTYDDAFCATMVVVIVFMVVELGACRFFMYGMGCQQL